MAWNDSCETMNHVKQPAQGTPPHCHKPILLCLFFLKCQYALAYRRFLKVGVASNVHSCVVKIRKNWFYVVLFKVWGLKIAQDQDPEQLTWCIQTRISSYLISDVKLCTWQWTPNTRNKNFRQWPPSVIHCTDALDIHLFSESTVPVA